MLSRSWPSGFPYQLGRLDRRLQRQQVGLGFGRPTAISSS
jgi:hypothetical protein